jgi:hypothetical protein
MRRLKEVVSVGLLYVFTLDTMVFAQVRPLAVPAVDVHGHASRAVPPIDAAPPEARVHREAAAPQDAPASRSVGKARAVAGPAAATAAGDEGQPLDLRAWTREGDPATGVWIVSADGC